MKDLNVFVYKTIKHLQETGKILLNIGLGNNFLNDTKSTGYKSKNE